ncbi:MAG: hypothetical protein COY66_03870 [Candidatus Kerfeldbacteria bacterium CG_4_10_14_0_8_um_filter_42_10]|uniref:Histidine kinase N-terminal 7TM region domain-containing protein n=1 Tax=Candidatus Kerfeldbacteria bacterium CG_4_10_14_0_8_um_filter_42_10 TaxID=2014248 RepID=A0A2M7RIJ5_9BACT|nr:MAG: hypothetical protein COY66_03870 [Candidatus Kerfeldbacteria bacterium CG_4_10_14_0_8_um_filter_42_10]
MVQAHGIILIIIAALELFLGIYILLQNPRDHIRRWYAFLVFMVALWVWSIGFVVFTNDIFIIDIVTRLNWVGPIFIASTLLFFSWIFPYPTKRIGIKNWLIFFFPMVIDLFLLYWDVFPIFKSIKLDPWRTVVFGPGVHVFNALFLFYWIWGTYNFYHKFRAADGIHKWLLKYFLIGIIISSIFGVTSNLILPWFGLYMKYPVLSAIGPELSIIWLGFTGYILFKKNIKHV